MKTNQMILLITRNFCQKKKIYNNLSAKSRKQKKQLENHQELF
jgi:hypothetical protein